MKCTVELFGDDRKISHCRVSQHCEIMIYCVLKVISNEESVSLWLRCWQNIVVCGERRMGKTSLVKRAVLSVRGERMIYKGGRKMAVDTAKALIVSVGGMSGDVQELCDAIWAATDEGNAIDQQAIRAGSGAVKRVLNKLVSARLVHEYNGSYRFVNPFFREWIKQI